VYILAFVGAVIMLFLSVILMLPTSVMYVNSQEQLAITLFFSTLKFESPNTVPFGLIDIF
jgi:NADH:ubiquinone oxidoreductase subunit 6 (subunit J)